MKRHLRIYRDRNSQWRWTLRASNGRKLANCGEGYRRRRDCERIAYSLFPWAAQKAPSEPAGPR